MSQSHPYTLGIVCMFRNPNVADLMEWIAYHRLAGVERFILYDHGHPLGHSSNLEDIQAAVDAFAGGGSIELRTAITPQAWRHPPLYYGVHRPVDTPPDHFKVNAAYVDALESERDRCQWLAFIDHDEFIHHEKGSTLPDYLHGFDDQPEIGAILMQMRRFGASGHTHRPDGLVLENYRWREQTFFPDTVQNPRQKQRLSVRGDFHKTIGRCADLERPFFGTHSWETRPGTLWYREDGSLLQLKHYFTKSEQEYRIKQSLGGFWQAATHQTWKLFDKLNKVETGSGVVDRIPLVEDRSMLAYAEPVRKILAGLDLDPCTFQSPQPILPNVLIAGAMKAGTSAAAVNLARHPDIWFVDDATKLRVKDEYDYHEVHFFDEEKRWQRGVGWYARFFETAGDYRIVGEKSANYLCALQAHPRIRQVLPGAQILVFLRDPVERAYSHWNHARQLGATWNSSDYASLEFNEAIQLSLKAPAGERDLLWNGYYARHLRSLFRHVPREAVHIAFMERVKANMEEEYNRIYRFLELPVPAGIDYKMVHERQKSAAAAGPGMDDATRTVLKAHFHPHNEELFELLGERIPEWD